MQEKIIETKQCKHCNSSFEITDKDLEFYDKISPSFPSPDSMESGLGKYKIPSPTLCPDCRQQRRLSFRNERKLYKRKCDATGKLIISMYSPDKKFKVYDNDFWWSDKCDGMDYGIDFDFNKTFFEQFNELMKKVPKISLFQKNNENSIYTNHTDGAKNSYLCVDTANSENINYSKWIISSSNCIDCYFLENCENCFECMNLENSYKSYYSYYGNNLSNCLFTYNCNSCSECIMCYNLNNKKYCILNKEYEKDIYFKMKEEIFNNLGKEYEKFINNLSDVIRKNLVIYNSENSIGDFLWNCKNVIDSHTIIEGENIKYSYDCGWISNSYDTYEAAFECEFQYESHACNRGKRIIGGHVSYDINNCYYVYSCHNSSNLFGCIGLRNKEYCILNKQYTKEEYEILVPKIIEHMMKTGEWGEFFPSNISPFGYNETVAMEYYPISPPPNLPLAGEGLEKSQMVQFCSPPAREGLGEGFIFNRSTYIQALPKVEKIIPADKLPEDISKIPDDILNWAIECEITKKPFRIIKQELEFYRKYNLGVPKRHPDQRHLDRMKLRNPRKLYDRKCNKCGKDMKTTYSADRKEVVYCEECYNKEVY